MQEAFGSKIFMTNIYTDKQVQVPVTVIQIHRGRVLRVKTKEKDGYETVQVGFFSGKEKKTSKPMQGIFKAAQSPCLKMIKEIKVPDPKKYKVGDEMGIETMDGVTMVQVIGTSKGRGFAGNIKRHNFQRGRETHGNKSHRDPGSVGQHTFPARVFPGKRMAGHMGNARVTIRNIQVMEVNKEQGLLVLKGNVPGPYNSLVTIRRIK